MKAIIDCPTCRKQLRIPSDKRIRFNCTSCGTLIHADLGKITSSRKRIILDDKGRQAGAGRQRNYQGRPDSGTSKKRKASKLPQWVKWAVAGVFALLIGASAYKYSQREYYHFASIQETQSLEDMRYYLLFYPQGEYRKDVLHLRDSIQFTRAYNESQANCSPDAGCVCSPMGELLAEGVSYKTEWASSKYEECLLQNASLRNSFREVEIYREAFPTGKYLDSISVLEDRLWLSLRQQYDERSRKLGTPAKARDFVNQLLSLGQTSTKHEIRVNFAYEMSLRDWEDYPEAAHDILDTFNIVNNLLGEGPSYPNPSTQPPPSIRDYLRSSNSGLQNIIVNALQSRLDSVFSPNPFRLVEMKAGSGDTTGPSILIDYKIETLSTDYGQVEAPELYVHQRSVGLEEASNEAELELQRLILRSKKGEDVTAELQALQKRIEAEERAKSPHGLFLGYLLATSIDWQMEFQLPNSDETYEFASTSQPNSSFSNIQNNRDAYRRMMESTFVNYAVQLAEGFGW